MFFLLLLLFAGESKSEWWWWSIPLSVREDLSSWPVSGGGAFGVCYGASCCLPSTRSSGRAGVSMFSCTIWMQKNLVQLKGMVIMWKILSDLKTG